MRYPNLIHTKYFHILLGWRGVFLAVFAALFLTACGGGAAVDTSNITGEAPNTGADCETNPFGEGCGVEFITQQEEKINECLIGNMAGTPDCAEARAEQSCLGDPFADGCDEDAGFSIFLEVAKQEREAFCTMDDNAKDRLCVGAVATLCGGNPFNDLCTADSYTDEQEQIVADCITEDKAAASPCAAAVKFNPCVRNPFTPECVTQTGFRTTREAFCRQDDNAINALCAGAVAHFCADDPFDAICDDAAYSRQQSERAAFCISGANASNNALCANAIAADNCIRDPFTSACSTQDVARSIRESFCRKSTNAVTNPTLCGMAVVHFCANDPLDGLCDPATLEMQLCTNDPFDTACDDNEYSSQQMDRTTLCISEDNASDDALCKNAIAEDACIGDPYGTGCESKTDARTARESYCRGNDNPTLCGMAVTYFCMADPFDSICKESNFATFVADRATRVTECIAEDKADDPTCANAVKFNACIGNPFTPECRTQTDFRTTREAFCRQGDNGTTALCAGAVAHLCAIDPFESLCNVSNFASYTSARGVFESFCRAEQAGRSDDPRCANAVTHFCTDDPFDSLCSPTTYETERNTRDMLCRASDNALGLANDTQCTGVLAHFCTDDPYDAVCNPVTYASARTGRVAECITGDNAKADNTRCTNAIADNICIRNPFTPACKTEIVAQTARKTFCSEGDNATTNGLCNTAVVYFCDTVARNDADPFDVLCDATYSTHRATRTTECIMSNNARADNPRCTNAIADNACIRNPFMSECSTQTDARDARETYCRGNDNPTLCTGAIVHVCELDPFDTLCDDADYSLAQSERVNFCIRDDNASNDLCKGAIADAVATDVDCISDPFTTACADKATARTARETFCRAGNKSNELCTGAVVYFCDSDLRDAADPFDDELCNATDHSSERTARIAFCAIGDNASKDALCANAINANPCIRDPYEAGCDGETNARTMREAHCRAGFESDTLCTGAVKYFCDSTARSQADPFESLCNAITHQTQRSMRESACRARNNALAQSNAAECRNLSVHFCAIDPYDGVCNATTYETEREARFNECIIGDKASADSRCTNALAGDACIRNPFATECASKPTARTARETYCRASTNATDNPTLCADAVVHFCDTSPTANPFDTDLCSTYGTAREGIIMDCIAEDATQLDNTDCTNAMKANPCIRNPFNTNCKDDFATYYLSARTNRETFCKGRVDSTYDSTLCAGAIVHVCEDDPFETLCNNNNNDDYALQKRERTALCIKDANASDTDLCAKAIGANAVNACISDPFTDACRTQEVFRSIRESFCRASAGNEDNPLCAGAVEHFCTADPYDDLCNEGNFTPYVTARGDRVTACITGDNASDDALCENAIDADKCILDPYAAGCESTDSTPTAAQTARTTFCRAGNEGNALCASTVSHFCTDDPFDALCDAETYKTERATRLMVCQGTTDLPCTNALRRQSCIDDPFIADCNGQADMDTVEEVFCRKGTNATTRVGDCQDTINRVCGDDPFDKLCDEGTYSSQRDTRVTTCIAGDNASNDDLCANAIADNACIRDPYGAGCDGDVDGDGDDEAQMMRETHCRAGFENTALCVGTVSHFCTIDPYDALCDDNTYSSQQMERTALCIKDANASDPDLCGGAIADAAVDCITDPFTTACAGEGTARTARETYCRGNVNLTLCANAIVHFCDTNTRPQADPFDGLCDEITHSGQRATRVLACIAGDKADDPTCANAVKFNACIRNPFTTECSTETVARDKRKEFCDESDNATKPLCAGAVVHFCAIDPYDDLCDDVEYSRQQDERVDFCIRGDNASKGDLCANAILQDNCIETPYDVSCGTETTAQAVRESFCRASAGNEDNPLCAGAVLHFCGLDPFDGLCKESNFTPYATARAARVAKCIMGDNASDVALCAKAIADDDCIFDPYGAGCDGDVDNDGMDEAQKMRETHCRAGNEGSTLCAGTVEYFCDSTARIEADPFDTLCDPETYRTQQANRLSDCEEKVPDPRLDCTSAILEEGVVLGICTADPFDTRCSAGNFARFVTARSVLEGFCRAETTPADEPLCANAVLHFCAEDPFDSLCNPTNYVSERDERDMLCRATDNALGHANDTQCKGAIAHFCTADPYDTLCNTTNFVTFIADRGTRDTLCRDNDNQLAHANDTQCKGAIAHFCEDDPFDTLCNATNFADFTPDRVTRDTLCRDNDNLLGHANDTQCKGAIAHFCTTDPFDTLCNTTNFTNFTRDRGTRDTLCRENNNALGHANDTQCAGAIAHFCTADPFDTLCNTTNFTNFTRDRGMRESDCRTTNDPTRCAGAARHFCDSTARPEADPFDGLCDENLHSMQRATRITECITGNNARVNNPESRCIKAIKNNPCIRNPFTPECSTQTEAQNARKIFCSEGDNSSMETLCTEAVVYFCDSTVRPAANPFDADLCFDGTTYNDAREKRTQFCLMQVDNSNPLCEGLVASEECFNNPFIRDLTTGAEVCGADFAPRRAAPIRRCIVDDEGSKPACISVLAGVGGCLENPFHSNCDTSPYFKDFVDEAEAARVEFCDMDDGTINDDDYCFGRTFVHDICTYDPFSSFCADESFNAAEGTTLQVERSKKIIFCGGNNLEGDSYNENHGSCAHVFDLVTAATWAHGHGDLLSTGPNESDTFLRATSATELDKTGATAQMELNLATSTFDHNSFGGDAHDGVEFFQVLDSGARYYYYAGILGAANLGEPLSDDARVMYWNGRISSTTSTVGGVIVATDFTLKIEFKGSDRTLTSFAKVFLDDSTSNHYYHINADFNERGLITDGTVVYAEFTGGNKDNPANATSAKLTGIIGEEGALGVFVGVSFSGGFVASKDLLPRVESSDWVRGFATSPSEDPTEKNQFLQQTKNVLKTAPTKITAAGADTTGVETLELNTIPNNQPDGNGGFIRRSFVNDVAWFSGFIGDTQYHYAGLSQTAYLGEPLNEAPVSSTWYGQFGVGASRTDFALDIAFATGKISAFVRESAGVYYLLAGDFNRAGVITNGTVNYGAFINGVRNAPVAGRAANGTLTGLIGQGGALGVFISDATGADGYSGGFYASESGAGFGAIVDYNTWSRNFLSLADNPDTVTPQNQFLGGTVVGISTTITQASGTVTARTLNLTTMNLDGDALGGVNTNRVDWFSGDISGDQYYYAGIFGDANLGAPLTETPTGGEWRGIIGVGGTQTDFTLTVTYGTTVGDRIGTVGTISAFVRDTPNVYYRLEGGFDASGLIVGTVKYGEFSDRDTPVGTTVDGVLDGLIGRDGALGVFYSTATGADGYSGGFVARPNAPEYAVAVKYSDYQRSFLTLGSPDTTTPKNQFVTDTAGVMTEQNGGTLASKNNLALNTNTFDSLALGGTTDNSLFWFDGFADNGMRRYYAGLDASVDLGAPISGGVGMTAGWRGVFGVGSAKTDFTLEIEFTATGGLISAFIGELEDSYYLLAGDFDASGLITGTVKYGKFTDRDTPVGTTEDGILTGLIGSQGAIGAFYSTATGPTGYSGGFVARDNVADFAPLTVGYQTWSRSFLLTDTPDVSKPGNQFLRAQANGELDIAGGTNSIIINLDTATFNTAPIDGDENDRYQLFNNIVGGEQRNYVGILPSTDLGAFVAQDNSTSAIWYGSFRGVNAGIAFTSDFVLHLTLDGTGGRLSARANYRNTDYYILDGKFDASGLITGTVAYNSGSFEDTTSTNGILTGLIGQDGAIGVFIGGKGINYGGGFVAAPKTLTFTDSIKYSDWVARENPDLTPTAQNQFLQTTNKDISTGDATVSESYSLSLNSTTFDGARILGDINNGLAYFTGTIGAVAYAYAGIYDSTDLGAPLTQNATWNGVVGFNGVEKPASFTIEFTGKGGTIEAFIADIIATEETADKNDFLIEGTFDDLGLITGTVNYAEYTGDLVGGEILNTAQAGVLSGLIGAEGAVGVFHSTLTGADAYSGGFITSADIKEQVNIDKWRDSFNDHAQDRIYDTPLTESATRQNQFLSGKTTNFSITIRKESQTFDPADVITLGLGSKLGLAEAAYKGISLGGDNTGGISFLHGFQSGDSDRLWYAYLNNDSKLGTRIADTTGVAEYHGQFLARARSSVTQSILETDADFTLTVNFERESILSSFIKENNSQRFYQVSGKYSAAGVITGEVEYGSFTAGTFTAERVGLVSGLISHDNALGVFIGVDTPAQGAEIPRSIRGLVPTGLGNTGFVGGFVARRFVADDNDTNVRYTDWAEWFIPRIKADTITPKSQFLTTVNGVISTIGTNAPTDITTATLNDIYYKPVEIPGDVMDGFSYFTADGYGYAGILDSTDLGAPVRAGDVTADWHGQLNFNTIAPREFTIALTYDTDGGTIAGFLSDIVGQTDFALNGDFNEYGLITGRTNFAEYTDNSVDGRILNTPTAQAGVLSGIIGREGAVAVFHGLEQNTYVGGFVVHPQGADGEDVSYSDWIRGTNYRIIANQSNQFLQTENGVINTKLVDNSEMTVTPAFETPATYLTLNNLVFDGKAFNGDGNDGLGYFVLNTYHIVGILDTTNLGAPLTQTDGFVLWRGQLDFIARSGTVALSNLKAEPIKNDFILKITFNSNGGRIAGSVEELTVDDFTGDFFIDGAFDSQGLINSNTSTTYFGSSSSKIRPGTLTGIIGSGGAVGVFWGSQYAGGFVAHPKVVGRVSYSDWEDPNSPFSDTYSGNEHVVGFYETPPSSGNHFLSTTNDVISLGEEKALDSSVRGRIERASGLNRIVISVEKNAGFALNYVRFDTASHNIEPLRASKAIGGFVDFTGYLDATNRNGVTSSRSNQKSYAGILDSTDLGPALTQTAGTVQWKGQLSFANYYSGGNGFPSGIFRKNHDFTLNIEFTATGGKVNGFVVNVDSGLSDPSFTGNDLYLEGTFDENGVISGDIARKKYKDDTYTDDLAGLKDGSVSKPFGTLGKLSGLIGSHGAVGVFLSNHHDTSGGGGFIVAPSASVPRTILEDYAAWQASFDSAPATIITSAENRFLSGSDDTVFANLRTEPNGGATPATVTNLNLNTTMYKGNPLGGPAVNSVSFANGYFNDTNTTIRSFHAAIDADANLGAVLPVWATGDTATATWKGVFAAEDGKGIKTNTDFDLTVDFENRRIQAEVPIIADIRLVYRLNGYFPVDLDGAIIGTVIRTDAVSGINSGSPNDPYPPAVLTGLIGEHGAIGVFVSGSRADNVSALTGGTGNTGYSGGFVACDYDDTLNRCK